MKISFVIPAYNEAENIITTISEIKGCLHSLENKFDSFEFIVVDDCSTDNTYEKVAGGLAEETASVRCFKLSRRSGSHVALRAGLDAVSGDCAVCISADGQDDPHCIDEMISRWENGLEIVWALRQNREDEPLLQKSVAKVFYQLLALFGDGPSGIDFSRADFYLLDKKVVNAIRSCSERNTSLFGLIAWLGFNQGYIEYQRRPRRSGESKWNFKGKMRLAQDWIIAFSGLPLKLMTYSGFATAGLGFMYAVVVIIRNLIFGSPLMGWPSVMTAILLLGGGQMMMLGIIGEYLWRTLDESRDRPSYFIARDTHCTQAAPYLFRRSSDRDSETPSSSFG